MIEDGLSLEESQLVARIADLSADFLSVAADTDRGGAGNALLAGNVRRLAEAGFFGVVIAKEYGGLGIRDDVSSECVRRIAAACGATAFTQNQLHSGGGFVGQAQNEDIKRELLPELAKGNILCGVAFSHLRRPGAPLVRARLVANGYTIDGEAPWVTGWRLLDSFILGTVLEDGRLGYFYAPIHANIEHLIASAPLELSAMEASDTVKVRIEALQLDERYLLFTREPAEMIRADYCSITGHVTLPLGCAMGSIALLRQLAEEKSRPGLIETAERYELEVRNCLKDCIYWNASRADDPLYLENALSARARANKIALMYAQAAVAATGGQAHLLNNPAQRRVREASFYATVAITPEVQTALLKELES